MTPAELIDAISSELESASASPEPTEPEVPAVAPSEVEVALRVLMV